MDCPFCNMTDERTLYVNDKVRVFRDGFPLTEGHTLITPTAHIGHLLDIPSDVYQELWLTVGFVQRDLRLDYGVNDFTVAVNDGVLAGQTIPHAHIHVIPRRPGDVTEERMRGGIRWLFPDVAAYWK